MRRQAWPAVAVAIGVNVIGILFLILRGNEALIDTYVLSVVVYAYLTRVFELSARGVFQSILVTIGLQASILVLLPRLELDLPSKLYESGMVLGLAQVVSVSLLLGSGGAADLLIRRLLYRKQTCQSS